MVKSSLNALNKEKCSNWGKNISAFVFRIIKAPLIGVQIYNSGVEHVKIVKGQDKELKISLLTKSFFIKDMYFLHTV